MTDVFDEIEAQVLGVAMPSRTSVEVDATRTPLIAIFEEKSIRILGTVEDPLFSAADVAAHIGNSHDYTRVVSKYASGEYIQKIEGGPIKKGERATAWYLTEAGLYKYLLRAKGEKAEEFQRYVYKLLKGLRAQCVAAALEVKEQRIRELEAINADLSAGTTNLRAALERRNMLLQRVPEQIERPLRAGCVYFIGEAGNPAAPTKIGYGKSVAHRLRAAQTFWPAPLEVRRAIIVSTGLSAERRAHAHFNAHHVYGEWYNLTPEAIAAYTDE